ncbi:MAG: divalent-cation tolerance protein CutA [Actinomycetia bacterium]|nr:divalent-cation tolerance protein CutA [Actinomycetes bacterium]
MSLVEIRIAVPNEAVGGRIAQALINARLAACVQQLPGLVSTYIWEERVTHATEHLLLVKTAADRFEDVCAAVLALHPHETPEILAVPVTDALPAYAQWVLDQTKG